MNDSNHPFRTGAIEAGVVPAADGSHRARLLKHLLQSLRGRLDWRGRWWRRGVLATKYIIRVLCMPRWHGRYLDLVHDHPQMRAYRYRDPRVLERHFHRYVNLRWNRHMRLRSIQQHYQFALERLPAALFTAIYVDGNAELGKLRMKDGSELKLCLRPPIIMGCEGELCIQLSDADDHPVYRIILTVIDDRPTLAIGCIQGPDGEHARDAVRELTRNMHGMRPKQLMLSLVHAFARHYGIERLWAIGNAAQPIRQKRRKFWADYDAFWLEQQGTEIDDGWFQLPATPSRKSEAEVPSSHRAAFRRREALRMEAERMLTEALGATPRRAVAHTAEGLESIGSFRSDIPEASWAS